MVDSSDEALWQVALLGDGRAFAALFRMHGDAVFRQALRFSVDPADAEEVAAAAFFELWRSRARVRLVEGSVLPWLLVTAANLGRNGLRSARRRDALLRRVVEQHDRRSAEPVDEVDAGVDRIDLARSLASLPRSDAALVTLVALEGYRPAEAAVVLGLDPRRVRMRLHRARVKLRSLLGDPEPTPDLAEEAAP